MEINCKTNAAYFPDTTLYNVYHVSKLDAMQGQKPLVLSTNAHILGYVACSIVILVFQEKVMDQILHHYWGYPGFSAARKRRQPNMANE